MTMTGMPGYSDPNAALGGMVELYLRGTVTFSQMVADAKKLSGDFTSEYLTQLLYDRGAITDKQARPPERYKTPDAGEGDAFDRDVADTVRDRITGDVTGDVTDDDTDDVNVQDAIQASITGKLPAKPDKKETGPGGLSRVQLADILVKDYVNGDFTYSQILVQFMEEFGDTEIAAENFLSSYMIQRNVISEDQYGLDGVPNNYLGEATPTSREPATKEGTTSFDQEAAQGQYEQEKQAHITYVVSQYTAGNIKFGEALGAIRGFVVSDPLVKATGFSATPFADRSDEWLIGVVDAAMGNAVEDYATGTRSAEEFPEWAVRLDSGWVWDWATNQYVDPNATGQNGTLPTEDTPKNGLPAADPEIDTSLTPPTDPLDYLRTYEQSYQGLQDRFKNYLWDLNLSGPYTQKLSNMSGSLVNRYMMFGGPGALEPTQAKFMDWLKAGGAAVGRPDYAERLRGISEYVRRKAADEVGGPPGEGLGEGDPATGLGLDRLLGEVSLQTPGWAKDVVSDYATMGRGLWSPYIKKLIERLYERKGGEEMEGDFLEAAIAAGFIPGASGTPQPTPITNY